MAASLDRALEGLPRAYPGPGGAAAVLRDGEVVARTAWGWADAERRVPFTPGSLFRICSITKQFVCGLALLETVGDPSALDDAVRARLPRLEAPAPDALRLCHNQSGLRDYWALAMLHGAAPEQSFGEAEATAVIGGARSLQFAPGTRYSYANNNFRILGDALQERAGRGLDELLRTRLFDRVGMPTARLAPNTSEALDGTQGYEGSQAAGFRPAVNRIVWTGDAGMAASLDDMIAWERHVDATRDDPDALYSRLSAPTSFADGAPAVYGFGLRRSTVLGRPISGHGGALRGWRSHRLYAPTERLSVVVLFNHMADAHDAALGLFAAALGETRPDRPVLETPPPWLGAYLDPETQLSARVEALSDGVRLRFSNMAEALAMQADGAGMDGEVSLRPDGEGLAMRRPPENLATRLARLPADPGGDIRGRYRCDELDAELTVTGEAGACYGAFSGFLGEGRMELLDPIGRDVWAVPCPRALDHTPPGDWTLAFQRDGDSRPTGVTVGCWLARGLSYARA